MMLLLKSSDYFERGLACVPHGASQPDYKKIYDGNYALALAIQDGKPDEHGPADICIGGVDTGEEEVEPVLSLEDAPATDDVFEFEDALVAIMEESLYGVDDIEDESHAPAPEELPPPLEPDIPPVGVDGSIWDQFEDSGDQWGVFKFTMKWAASEYGSLQVVCPFHKRNDRTGCKKTRAFGHDDAGKEATVRWLAYWAVRGQHHTRQRLHIADDNFEDSEVPSLAELVAMKVTARPRPADIRTDVDLDAVASAPSAG